MSCRGLAVAELSKLTDCPSELGSPGQSAFRAQFVHTTGPGHPPENQLPGPPANPLKRPVSLSLREVESPVARHPDSPRVASERYPFSLVGRFYALNPPNTRPSDQVFQDSLRVHRFIHRSKPVIHRTRAYPPGYPLRCPQLAMAPAGLRTTSRAAGQRLDHDQARITRRPQAGKLLKRREPHRLVKPPGESVTSIG